MFNHKSTKSAIFAVVAVLMLAAIMLTACNPDAFKPVTMPENAAVEGNGGNAVKYGKWIYYVNGYQSSTSAENTYTQVKARVGAVARISVDDLNSLFAVYDDTNFTTSSARTKEIARIVDEKAQIVVPKFYYSGNTTSTQINGIYIFKDRLYILTPNDELTAGGNSQASQSVLTSFKLDGSDEQRHYVFTNNAAQVMLNEDGDNLYATYIMGSEVGSVDVKNNKLLGKVEETSSATIDVAGKAVFYIKDKAICKLASGAAEGKVVVANDEHSTVTYTISNVNNGYVYYTKADTNNSSLDGISVYYATEGATATDTVALKASAPSSNWFGYKDGVVKTFTDKLSKDTLYGIVIVTSEGAVTKQVVNPVQNDNSITFNRVEGDMLYYTSNDVAYVVDLSKDDAPVAIGKSLASASGWSVPDVLGEYVITLGTGSVSAVKFDKDARTNSSSVTLTIVEPAEEE